jgi:hypothetical protein
LQQGEIANSIAYLQRWFAPAIKSKLMEVRVHVFSQEQVEDIVRSMAKAPYV